MTHFRQFRDPASETLSYLLVCDDSGAALIIDPVSDHVPLYLGVLGEVGARLEMILETHLHADHLSGADSLRRLTGARVAAGRDAGIEGADRRLDDGDTVAVGMQQIEVLATPGHTAGCLTYRWGDRLFTGDSLLIGGCGRIDEPGSNGIQLFDSVTRRLLSQPAETLVYPGHAHAGRWVSCIGEERDNNPFFHGVSRDGFVSLRNAIREPHREDMDAMRAANRRCGVSTALPTRKA